MLNKLWFKSKFDLKIAAEMQNGINPRINSWFSNGQKYIVIEADRSNKTIIKKEM